MTGPLLAFALVLAWGGTDGRDWTVREWVYQAEVHGRRAEALDALRELLSSRAGDAGAHARVVRAISAVKRPAQTNAPAMSLTPEDLARPLIAAACQGQGWLQADGLWLELGDWIGGGFFLAGVQAAGVVLERVDGFSIRALFEKPPAQAPDGDFILLRGADAGDALGFVAKREGLNSYVPSALERKLDGVYALDGWAGFLDRICEETGVYRTRRRDSLVFHLNIAGTAAPAERITLVDRKNESLGDFLQSLAEAFDMELVLDDSLAEVAVDIQLQDQPWDEALDCLSLMNGFSWFLASAPGERDKLYIQQDPRGGGPE